jgi:hypothetical protein
VYGKKGILDWIRTSDRRAGRVLTHPDKEDQHLINLRRPKHLNQWHINFARRHFEQGRTLEWVVARLYVRTKYINPISIENALIFIFRKNGWYVPDPVSNDPYKYLTKRRRAEMIALESKLEQIKGLTS